MSKGGGICDLSWCVIFSLYTLQGVGAAEMRGRGEKASEPPVIGIMDTFSAPGTYTLDVPCPRTRSTATVRIEMTDSHGIKLVDSFSLSFHMHFHRLLKWLVALPLLGSSLAILAMQRRVGGPVLPSFSRSHEF